MRRVRGGFRIGIGQNILLDYMSLESINQSAKSDFSGGRSLDP